MTRKTSGEGELTSFVGRRTDLTEGRRLLGNARLVTLVGPGGVGKTRLARRLADEVARAFPDGIFLVELADLHDSETLAVELAASFGLDDVGSSLESTVASFVRERRLLLVLDNCEHLVEAAADLVDRLLQLSPGLRVLSTSRQPLGVTGEQLLVVDPLSLVTDGDPGSLGRSEAVDLFVERARLVLPTFELTADNTALVTAVCTTLDGMPLAIELAAARLRVLSLPQLADRLHDRFGLLTVAATSSLARHQTLRASVDWSFDLCSAEEQTLWAWLSVFEGGCDLEAAEAVCDGTGINVFDTVAGLVDKSVLIPQEASGRVRYRMLDTIQAYGRERLVQTGHTQEVAERHRAYFVALARSSGQSWFGPGQRELMARTTADHANLRAAFDACLASTATHQDALELCTSLWWFWVGHGGVDELLRWLRKALEAEQPATPLTLHAMTKAAFLASLRSDHALVSTLAARAVALSPPVDSVAVRWDRRWAQTLQLAMAGDAAAAAGVAVSMLRDKVPIGLQWRQETVTVLVTLATPWFSTSNEEALHHLENAVDICRGHGDQWNLGFVLAAKSARLADLGHYDEAVATARQALRLGRGFNSWAVVHALDSAARCYARLGNGTRAAVLAGALTSWWPDVGGVLLRPVPPRHDSLADDARELLGEQEFRDGFARGRAMSLEEVVGFVLDDEPATAGRPVHEAASGRARLTRREREVAELVARGLSNKEIARVLVLSPRTAEGHVARLLDKLGFDSRARVAAWVAEHRAAGR